MSESQEDPTMSEAMKLIIRLFEDQLDSKSASRLDELVCRRKDVRRLYVNLAHQYCTIVPLIASRAQASSDGVDGVTEAAAVPQSLNETMILPALRDLEATGENQDDSTIFQPAPFQPTNLTDHPRQVGRWWYKTAIVLTLSLFAAIAASIVLSHHGNKVQQAIQPQTPQPQAVAPELASATISATAGAIMDGSDIVSPRTELMIGRTLNLTGGAIELRYGTGAVVVIRAPAQVRIADRNALALDAGSVYAHVPPSAIGFRVIAPGLGVVDRGTNFGVRITPDLAGSEVHVFDGRVDATALDQGGNSSGAPMPVTAGVAVAHSTSAPNLPLVPVQFQASAFDRDIDRIKVEVPTHGTGQGVDAGLDDPLWQLIAAPGFPNWKARPASVVVDPRPEYTPNTDKAKWISTFAHMDNVAGGDYIYRTTIDLTGFDPSSVSASATFAVDDNLREIRVNGVALPLPNEMTLGMDGGLARTTTHLLTLPNAKWISGPNQVDVVVWNLTGGPNFTGLQLSWSISARRVVLR